ncbi:MAG: hypothetical protein ACRCW4_08295 [Candidatus Neomicrothrix subdominans]
MTLPSMSGGATTAQVGYFEVPAEVLANWVVAGFDAGWSIRQAEVTSLEDLVAVLAPSVDVTRYVCLPFGRWTAMLSNGPLGTDVGVLPSYAARELGCRAMRVVDFDNAAEHPARVLEVYGPDGVPPLGIERSIVTANDGGRWVFETVGTAYAFEDQSAYARRTKSSRFTSEMVGDCLRELGVPVGQNPDWAEAILIERAQ